MRRLQNLIAYRKKNNISVAFLVIPYHKLVHWKICAYENQIIHPPVSGSSIYTRFQNTNLLESCKIMWYQVPVMNKGKKKKKKNFKSNTPQKWRITSWSKVVSQSLQLRCMREPNQNLENYHGSVGCRSTDFTLSDLWANFFWSNKINKKTNRIISNTVNDL